MSILVSFIENFVIPALAFWFVDSLTQALLVKQKDPPMGVQVGPMVAVVLSAFVSWWKEKHK